MEHKDLPRALPCPDVAPAKAPPAPAPPRVAVYCALLALAGAYLAYPSLANLAGGDVVFGVNVPLCVGLLYAAFALSMRGQRGVQWSRGWPMLLVIAPLALSPALFSVPELILLNILALCVLLPLHLSLLAGGNWHRLFGVSLLEQGVIDILGRPLLYIPDGCRATLGKGGRGILHGALLAAAGAAAAAPVLLIVVVLLAFADENFENAIDALLRGVDVPQVILVLFAALLAFFPLLSMLYSLPLGKHLTRPQAPERQGRGIHPVPVYAALILFDAVLLLFSVVHFQGILRRALFLPRDYSAFAHEGFFPMLAAAAICFGVQWVCLRFTRREGRALPLRILVTAMSAGLLLMMASAMRSILLYQGMFGMTRLRAYVTVCIGVLFVLLIFMILRIWVMKKGLYRAMTAALLCAALVGMSYCNIDRMIAKNNIAMRDQLGSHMDYGYLASLSADALDVLAQDARWPEGGGWATERLQGALAQNEREARSPRVWNLGRARARAAYERSEGYAADEAAR